MYRQFSTRGMRRCVAFSMLLLIFTSFVQTSWADPVTLYASDLGSQNIKNLKITSSTTLRMNADLTLTTITGDYGQ